MSKMCWISSKINKKIKKILNFITLLHNALQTFLKIIKKNVCIYKKKCYIYIEIKNNINEEES